jgi:ABC-type uncharacterized transport system
LPNLPRAERRRRARTRLRRLLRRGRADPPLADVIAAAAAYAAAEIAAGLLVGGLFAWGRAEALLFFFFRPWLLLVAALSIAPWGRRCRILFYAFALGLAGFGESLLLLSLGGSPWAEMLRGWAAGALVALVIDLLMQLGVRRGCLGQFLATAFVVLLLIVPGAQRPYEWLALGAADPRPAAERPRLLLMSGLPLVWGETGPFDPDSRPASAYRALEAEYDVRPIDHADAASLGGARLMLLAQPRRLAPAELAALDAWVRGGGRVLILADPDLHWPTRLPLGDIRRPPPASLLSPLLDHWGIRLEAADGRRLRLDHLPDRALARRLALDSPGRFRVAGAACRVTTRDYLAVCAVGAGRAVLVADADLLRDDLWTGPGPRGSERHLRLSDNPLVVAGWLDRLAGVDRERAARPVSWQRPEANRAWALALAMAPILAALALFAALRFRRG